MKRKRILGISLIVISLLATFTIAVSAVLTNQPNSQIPEFYFNIETTPTGNSDFTFDNVDTTVHHNIIKGNLAKSDVVSGTMTAWGTNVAATEIRIIVTARNWLTGDKIIDEDASAGIYNPGMSHSTLEFECGLWREVVDTHHIGTATIDGGTNYVVQVFGSLD